MLVEKKDHKIELRVTSSELALIDRAAELSEAKRSQYVRRNVLRSASRTVSETQRLPLSLQDYDHLQAALEAPVRPAPRLKRLLGETSVFGE
jgi:uncharacterized protein (DUF1778 family)